MAPNPTYKSRKCRYCREWNELPNGNTQMVEVLWPPHDDYSLCPICQEPTQLSVTPGTRIWQEQEAERKEHAFGWYLLESWLSPTPAPS